MGQTDLSTSSKQYIFGNGEMGTLTRDFDWSKTVLGSPDKWPQSLLTTVGILLKSKFPMFLWWGDELTQFYNDAYRPSLGNNGKHPKALGQHGEDCWPEIWPEIKPMIDQVMATGESTWDEDRLIPIYRNGQMEDVYWTFSYSQVNDGTGKGEGILVTCNETTEKVNAFKGLEEAKKGLELAQEITKNQHDRIERFFMQAPVGICVLDGEELVYEMLNPLYQQLFPGRRLAGRPLFEALPEIIDQPIATILKNVYQTGLTYEGNELLIPLIRNEGGDVEDRYFNFIYQARLDSKGKIDGILVCVVEATETVMTRKEIENAYEQVRLSKQAAQLGTFDMDMIKGTMEWDDRCRLLFGINHQETVSYEKDFLTGLHPEDRDRVIEIVNNVFVKAISNGNYDVEYRTIGAEDGKLRWVRAKGKAYFDDKDKPTRFIVYVLYITEANQNEIRKNDFITMVSHELKTPLTSLNGYIQVVSAKANKLHDDFTIDALERANRQVKKMTKLIDGFLSVSNLEAGKILLDLTYFNLNDLITDIVEEIRAGNQSNTITISPADTVMINADYNKIGQVINNLLSNAIKYSPRGKNIELSTKRIDGSAIVNIKDEGMGIKPEDQKKLFSRFYRVESKHTDHISGFGIGLYFCAEVIEHHNGRIWVDSQSEVGSTFSFSLPISN